MFEDEPPDLRDLTNQELRELALGPDLWLNSPALAELGDRSPADARLVALDALQREDKLLVATALRVLGDSDLNSAIEYMRRTVSDAPLEVIDAMVDIVAVVHPFGPDSERELLSQLVERLWPPQGSREYNLADLLFRQYPHIRPV